MALRDINYKLDIFAYEDNPAASWIWSRPPELDVTSPKTISKAKAMISECHEHHIDCKVANPPRLPTRVINVHESTSPMIHLHIPEGNGKFDQYITLSYCWGGDQPVVALKHNLDHLRSGIPLAALPQTLQDAVQTTRGLGYQYLWADALCIIQDDNEDIAREIAAIAGIYRNSTATILAATSGSVREGYLNRPREQPCFITLPVKLSNGETGQIGIGHPCQWSFGWNLDPLSKRGWAFQESLLARRILFYGPYEVLFHRHSLGFTRLVPSYIKYPDDQQPSSRALFHSQDRAASWSEIVRQYTLRNFTFPEDRSRAITGIVEALEKVWDDKCVFGMWVSRFLEQMTWYNIAGFRFHPSMRRSNSAPSWSWLSIDGQSARLTLSCRVIPEYEWPTLESNLFNIYRDIEEVDESGGMPCFYLYLGSESHLSSE
ncbi:heterokaryon incompatibility protein-domain-containing protein [Bisporella sp. PMI_857]|nr:heterokaryon incompatibility protein-domain-containing protein [Bisporella sp. PMI_857]